MKVYHCLAKYLRDPEHPITINVIGVGGNGTQMLYHLAKINLALLELGHQGLKVFAYDDDIVEEHNLLRQSFAYADIGEYKSSIIINRINRFYGFNWEANISKYQEDDTPANILISCTDTVKSRMIVKKSFHKTVYTQEFKPYYWLDVGNSDTAGQFVLGTKDCINQPKDFKDISYVAILKDIFSFMPNDFEEEVNKPSCSAYESLASQDLFINGVITVHAANLLWNLLFKKLISYHGGFVNMEKGIIKPINLSV